MPGRSVKLTPPERTVAVQSYVVEIGKGLGITLGHFFKNWLSRIPWVTLAILAFVVGIMGAGLVLAVKGLHSNMAHTRQFLIVFGGVPACLGCLALAAFGLRKLRHSLRGGPPETYLRLRPYPDVPADYYPPRYRGEHRLMKRDDGTVRCVACMMCATVCPADCINIVAGDASDPAGDKLAPNSENEKFPIRFEIDELRCVVCGFCVEACPCDAIRMDTGVHVTAYANRSDFIYKRDRMVASGETSVSIQGGEGPGWRDR